MLQICAHRVKNARQQPSGEDMSQGRKRNGGVARLEPPRHQEVIELGVETASLLRRVRELDSGTLNYFFEMAWQAIYQHADEATRVALLDAVEADLNKELARLRKAG